MDENFDWLEDGYAGLFKDAYNTVYSMNIQEVNDWLDQNTHWVAGGQYRIVNDGVDSGDLLELIDNWDIQQKVYYFAYLHSTWLVNGF